MNKLITSLACSTVLSMSLLGVGSAANAAGTGGMGSAVPDTGANGMNTERTHMLNGTGTGTGTGAGTGTGIGNRVNNMMDRTTGTVNRTTDNIMRDNNRTGDNHTVSPLSNNNNNNNNGRYRATAANNNNDDGMDWGWLGLLGLLGLAGMRSKSNDRERERR